VPSAPGLFAPFVSEPAGAAAHKTAVSRPSVAQMSCKNVHSQMLVIKHPYGFHVRPVQRFAELAGAFAADVEVEIDGRKVSGKSVMGLVSLGGQYGARMKITACGEDARQALALLTYLVEENFFVEDRLAPENKRPERHVTRLARFASCFDSDVWVKLGDRKANARDHAALLALGLRPSSKVSFVIEGEDSRQAAKALETLVSYRFYVEEELGGEPEQAGG